VLKIAIVPRYFRVLAVAAAAPGLLVAGLVAPTPAAANCCVSGPTLTTSVSGGTVTAWGSGYTRGGLVRIQEEYCFWSACDGFIAASTYANGFHYVCNGSSCYRVYGDISTQFSPSPCSPYSVRYLGQDLTSGAESNWTPWAVVC
jgi:hypothetical protein